jgi:hypothetical protein
LVCETQFIEALYKNTDSNDQITNNIQNQKSKFQTKDTLEN